MSGNHPELPMRPDGSPGECACHTVDELWLAAPHGPGSCHVLQPRSSTIAQLMSPCPLSQNDTTWLGVVQCMLGWDPRHYSPWSMLNGLTAALSLPSWTQEAPSP